MTDEYKGLSEDKVISLLNKFYSTFFGIYQNENFLNKNIYARCCDSLFKKWYYSAVVGNTTITPAQIVEYLNPNSVAYRIKNSDYKNEKNLNYKKIDYSLESHPITYDFKNILSLGKNSIQFDTIGKLVNISKIELNELLSNTEDSYIYYLLELAMEMKLVTTIPSIGVTTFQSTDNANDVLKMVNRKLLDFMLDGAYELTKNKIIVNNVGKKEHIKKWITEFTEVDKVMRFLMELENGKNYTDDEFSMFLLEMGILFDKYFLTPYGYYFKLINPYYGMPFDMVNEFMFIDSLAEDYGEIYLEDYEDIMYSPCTSYSLSKLGREYYEKHSLEKNQLDDLDIDDVFDIVLNNKVEKYHRLRNKTVEKNETITLKMYDNDNPSESLLDKFNKNMSLAKLSHIICHKYKLMGDLYDYSFYTLPKTVFSEYRCEYENVNYNTVNITLKDIFSRFNKLYLEFGNNKVFVINKV